VDWLIASRIFGVERVLVRFWEDRDAARVTCSGDEEVLIEVGVLVWFVRVLIIFSALLFVL